MESKEGNATRAELHAATIRVPQQPRGWLHRRYGRQPMTVYNRRGKVVAWVGGRYLPVNGPVLWLVVVVALMAGLLGGIIGGAL